MRAILTYHSIDGSRSPISLDAAVFARHVAWLASGAVAVVPLQELAARAPEEDAVALTFDDGFASFAREAWPRLADAGLPATLFVVSGHAGGTNLWGGVREPGIPELPLLGWEELGRLAEQGVELGCHGRTHPDLAGLPRERVEEELAGACDDVQRETGVRPRSLAYPFGSVGDPSTSAAVDVARRRFDRACTTRLATLARRADPHLLPRLDAWYYRAPGRLEAYGGVGFRLHLRFRAAARRARELAHSFGFPAGSRRTKVEEARR